MELGGFDEPVHLIAGPGRDAANEKQLLKDIHIFSDSLIAEPYLTADLVELVSWPVC